MPTTETSFQDSANAFREELKKLEELAREYTNEIKLADIQGDKGEVIAQSILAMRHLEDARMRYGKVIQYIGDGVSVYDK